MIYFLILLICIVFVKPTLFVMSTIPIRAYFIKKKNERRTVNQKNLPSENKKTLKSALGCYFGGYIRFFIIQTGKIPSHRVRNFIYRKILQVNIAPKAIIYYGAEIRDPQKLRVGKGTIIGDNSILDARNRITIGDNVNFSSGVQIWTEQHDHRDPYFSCNSDENFAVNIGDRVWIGPRTIILHGVNIGEGAVVAAGAVVTKNVDPFTIVAGIPARKIGERSKELKYVFTGDYSPFY